MRDDAEILRARALALARCPEPLVTADTLLEILEFRLAHERYGIETRYVDEVWPLNDLTRLPCTKPFVSGIVNVRGRIVPVIDLKKLFDLPRHGLTDLHRVILIQGLELEVGLLADAAVEVRTIATRDLQPSLPTLTGIGEEYLKGVTPERIVVLDALRILADPHIIVHEDVES